MSRLAVRSGLAWSNQWMFNIVYSRKLVKFARLLGQRPNCDTSECSFNASVFCMLLYLVPIRTTERTKWLQNGGEPWNKWFGRAHALKTQTHCFKKQCKFHMEEITGLVLYMYIEIDLSVGCEQSWWMKGTFLSLLVWSEADTGSGADWYLTLSSQYKRSAGRNLGDTRHGTPL